MSVRLSIHEQVLTDGSKVYDVLISNEHREVIRLPAFTERDAHDLLEKLETAIGAHTTEEVGVV